MMPSEQQGMSPKKEKSLRRQLEYLKCGMNSRVNPDRGTIIQEFFLPSLQEKDLDNVWLQDGVTARISGVPTDILRAAFPE
ncbi:hypothetical protein TNCV_2688421 [Trichonephila clavipes]|nr:hypothetical protein TNCV_2688421 [Trichonephila clavipes]